MTIYEVDIVKHLFDKINNIIPVKTYLIWFALYFGMTGLFPLFYKITKASEETLDSINAFNTYVTIPTFILMLTITTIITWISYEVSKKNHENSKR